MDKPLLVIAPKGMQEGLLKRYRKNDPFFDVRFMDKASLMASFYGTCPDGLISYLMLEYGLTYELADAYRKYLPYPIKHGLSKRIDRLVDLKESLPDEMLPHPDEYLERDLKTHDVRVFAYPDDDGAIRRILDSFGIHHEAIATTANHKGGILHSHSLAEDEASMVLNDIASQVASGKDPATIRVLARGDYLIGKIKEKAPLYGLVIEGIPEEPISGSGYFKAVVKGLLDGREFDEIIADLTAKSGGNERFLHFLDVISSLEPGLLKGPRLAEYLAGTIGQRRWEGKRYDTAIRIDSDPFVDDGARVYVAGFSEGNYPKLSHDVDYLSDHEKSLIGMETSKEKNHCEKETLLCFFNESTDLVFSYSQRALSDSFFPSVLIEPLGLDEQKAGWPKYSYSALDSSFVFSDMMDRKRKYDEVDPSLMAYSRSLEVHYLKYDNSYKEGLIPEWSGFLSYSSLKTYNGCPFSYYASKVLKLDPFEETFYSNWGTLVHAVLEDAVKDSSFDFEKSFSFHMSEFSFDPRERSFAMVMKEDVEKAALTIIEHQKAMEPERTLTELSLKANLDDGTKIQGRIDKCLVDKGYCYLIDYKTGKELFDAKLVPYGFSLQLPTYALLAANDVSLSSYPVGGLYINSVLDPDLKDSSSEEDNDVPRYLKLHGVTLDQVESITGIEPRYFTDGPRFVDLPKVPVSGGLPTSVKFVSESTIQDYSAIALSFFKEAEANISKGLFPIRPTKIKNKVDACKNCPFRDVCFLRYEQINEVRIEDQEEEGEEDDG